MSNNEKFKGRYQVEDGYAGGARPQSFTIYAGDLDEGMTDDQLEELYEECMLADFQERIHPGGENASQFIAWAREQLAKRNAE